MVRQVWGLGERRFRDDFKRRMMLFKYLVLGVIMYGAETWSLEEIEELERIQKRYVKWSLNLDSCTPDFIVYRETDIEKIRTIAGCRAVNFEERALKEGIKKLVIECIKEEEKGWKNGEEIEERGKFYRENGYSSKGIKILREREVNVTGMVKEREMERFGQWIEGKIARAKYNVRYKEIKAIAIARWRCGNEEDKNRFWMAEEKRKCKICKEAEGSLEHAFTHINRERLKVSDILGDDGEGRVVVWIRELKKLRDASERKREKSV